MHAENAWHSRLSAALSTLTKCLFSQQNTVPSASRRHRLYIDLLVYPNTDPRVSQQWRPDCCWMPLPTRVPTQERRRDSAQTTFAADKGRSQKIRYLVTQAAGKVGPLLKQLRPHKAPSMQDHFVWALTRQKVETRYKHPSFSVASHVPLSALSRRSTGQFNPVHQSFSLLGNNNGAKKGRIDRAN